MIKAIFTDLDDTFLYDLEKQKNNMYTVPKRSKEALKIILDNNIKFVIATGRLYGETVELLKRNNISCDLIVMDGCVAFDKDEHKLIDYHGISNVQTLEIMKLLRSHNISFFICDDRNYYGMNYQWMWLDQAVKDNDLEITRIIINGNKTLLEEAKKILKPWSSNLDIFEYPTNIVLQNKNTSKGKAILRFLKSHNLNLDEIAIFGDGINDDSMFELNCKSIFIEHGKSKYAKENSTYHAKDFKQGLEKLLKLS